MRLRFGSRKQYRVEPKDPREMLQAKRSLDRLRLREALHAAVEWVQKHAAQVTLKLHLSASRVKSSLLRVQKHAAQVTLKLFNGIAGKNGRDIP